MLSLAEARQDRIGWRRVGEQICLYQNHYRRRAASTSILECSDDVNYATLTFTLAFPTTNDECYLAYHYPYTYTHLQVRSVISIIIYLYDSFH
jgi:hypothetical protein